MKTLSRVLFLFFVLSSTNLFAQNQVFLEAGETLTYTALETQNKASEVSFTIDSNRIVFPKKDILGYTNTKGKFFTYNLKSGKKWKLKLTGEPFAPCTSASIHAYKYFKLKDAKRNPYLAGDVSSDASSCFEQQTKKIRTGRTIGVVGTVIALNISIGALISSMNDLNSL